MKSNRSSFGNPTRPKSDAASDSPVAIAFNALSKSLRRIVSVRRRLRGPMRPSWDEEFETLATLLHFYSKVSSLLPIPLQRKAIDILKSSSTVFQTTTFERDYQGGIPGAWFRRSNSRKGKCILYLHGGGYVIGSVDSHRNFLSNLCEACGYPVFAIDYRLAPEHKFPAQLEDASSAYRALLESYSAKDIIIGGESAGGGLTLSTLLYLRDNNLPLPNAALLISPWLDLKAKSKSFVTNAPFDFVSRKGLQSLAKHFVEKKDLDNPLASPILADLSGLPPLLIHAGGAEVLLNEAMELSLRARNAQVHVQLDIWPDMFHAFHLFIDKVREADEAIASIARFTETQFAK